MKNQIGIGLVLGLLTLSSTPGAGQVAKAPPAPAAPEAPDAEPAPPPKPDFAGSANAVVQEAQRVAREVASQARSGFSQRLASIITRVNPPSGTLVIPKDEADVKGLADTEEDMNVMAHILEKIASSPDGKTRRAMGIPVRTSADAGAPRNLYIDGYGAIFFLNVNYPLSAPPPATNQVETKAETPSEWDEARRELYQPPAPPQYFELKAENMEYGFPEAFSRSAPAEPYDADRVEELQKSLVAELKNASHIRNLSAHDAVTVVVSGRAPGTGQRVIVTRKAGGAGGGGGFGGGGSGGSGGSSGASSPVGVAVGRPATAESRGNQMIVRASRSDIESYQNGKLSYDEFRKKATVLIY